MLFTDRRAAGRTLANLVEDSALADPVVIALPRGGVVVGFEIARALRAPLDVLVVRKIGVPYQPELGAGALAEGGNVFLNRPLMERIGVTEADLEPVIARERAELDRRVARYRGDRAMVDIRDRTVVLVDDGLATGGTARTAAQALRALGAARIVLAVPVAAPDSARRLEPHIDALVCPHQPVHFAAIGQFYDDFSQTTDAEVVELLADAAAPAPGAPAARAVEVSAGPLRLPGILTVPEQPAGLVVFAHGSGSSRLSPRNAAVAERLNGSGLATLLFDLLTEQEGADRANVFDVPLLGDRLEEVTRWAGAVPELASLAVGYFGASTGAAAALWAAGRPGSGVAAVVSRGGRPDLAGERLAAVEAPTLLIVGERDPVVLELNEQARRAMRCPTELATVPGATHLFEEPGTLEMVETLAARWFTTYLSPSP